MNGRNRLFLCAACHLLAAGLSAGGQDGMDIPSAAGMEIADKPLVWQEDMNSAMAVAGQEYKPVLALFSSPDCSWCARLKTHVFSNHEMQPILDKFVLVEIDVTLDESTALHYGIRGVPTMVILTSDGLVRGTIAGYADAGRLKRILELAADLRLSERTPTQVELLAMLDSGRVPPAKWPEIMRMLGQNTARKETREKLLRLNPSPREQFVNMLKHPHLDVRMGAIEILEEVAGDSFGFDPWRHGVPGDPGGPAVERWREWAKNADAAVTNVYSTLSPDRIAGYIRDVVSGDMQRATRATRILEHGGPAALETVNMFLRDNPDLPIGVLRALKEIRYANMLPQTVTIDPTVFAHRLVFGTMDARLQSIAELQRAGRAVLPLLADLLADNDPIVRETAAENMIEAGGLWAVPIIERHLATERDVDVIHTILRGLGAVRSRKGLAILVSYLTHPNEDLVIEALESIARLKGDADVVSSPFEFVSETVKRAAKDASVSDCMRACMNDKRWRVRVAALKAVGEMELKGLADRVEELLEDEDEFVRYRAVETLASLSAGGAAAKLEKAFMREDSLKAPVVAALGRMNAVLPSSFIPALEGKDPDVLLGVIDSLEHSGARGLGIAARYAGHENDDVACAAIRFVAAVGMNVPRYQSMIADVIAGNSRLRALAALEALQIDKSDNLDIKLIILERSRESAGPKSDGDRNIDDLFDAFSSGDRASQTPEGGVEDAHAGRGASSPQELFDAFMEADYAEHGQSSADPANAFNRLLDVIEARMQDNKDPQLKFTAALALAKMGFPRSLPAITENIESRTAREREMVASYMGEMKSRKGLPVLKALLRDSSGQVRSEAAESCLENAEYAGFVDLLFEELTRPGTPLQPQETYSYHFGRAVRNAGCRQTVGKWARRILDGNIGNEMIGNFALVQLEKCWESGDRERVLKLVDSGDPFRRRAALHTLGRCDMEEFTGRLDRIMEDTSEYVRAVIPRVYSLESKSWIHYFDERHFQSSHYYDYYSGERRRFSLPDKARSAMLRLTEDGNPVIRLEAYFSLLSHRVEIDLARFSQTISVFPDRKSVSRRVSEYLTDNYRTLGGGFAVLLPHLAMSRRDKETIDKVYRHFGVNPDEAAGMPALAARTNETAVLRATFRDVEEEDAETAGSTSLKLVFFSQPGCKDCARVERMLPALKECFPELEIEKCEITKIKAMRFNECLCDRFDVPHKSRMVTPALFSGAGYLVGKDINYGDAVQLLASSASIPEEEWHTVTDGDLEQAERSVRDRYFGMGLGMIVLLGALDGINPCAFAAIILFLSYLQVARRAPVERIRVGIAFIIGVFLAYFGLGLGLVEVLARYSILRKSGNILNWVIGGFALVVAVLSLRDGILCLRGRMGEMALQLPRSFKSGIQQVVRRGTRNAHFVIAAFIVGMVVSLIEVPCTGQFYGPALMVIVKTAMQTTRAVGLVLIYNLAFIVPLIVIFILAHYGLKSDAMLRFLQRHAALVKFCTALLFMMLFVYFIFGNRLGLFPNPA